MIPRIYFIGIVLMYSHLVLASDLDRIDSAAKSNGCIPAGKVEKNHAYLKRLKTWFVKSKVNNATATMFWCQSLSSASSRGFILITSTDSNHPWAQCPSSISKLRGSPLNLSLEGADVSGEFDSGGYYFTCRDGKWLVKYSH